MRPEDVRRLVEQLAAERYRVRRAARDELETIVNVPDVADLLRAHLRTTPDAETKAVLESLLEGYDKPLAMVWSRVLSIAEEKSLRQMARDEGYPWLFISGDGQFVYDAASPLFLGKVGEPAAADVRTGTLSPRQLWRLKELIRTSGVLQAAPAPTGGTRRATGVEVQFLLRGTGPSRTSIEFWEASALAKGAVEKTGLHLALALRDSLAGCPSKAWDGPLALRAQPVARPMQAAELEKVPDWPVEGVNIVLGFQQGGLALSDQQVRDVRKALGKGNVYKYHKMAACEVKLIPRVDAARELFYGTAR